MVFKSASEKALPRRRLKSELLRIIRNLAGYRAVFKWLSKVITWLRLPRLVIGLKEPRQFFNQWEAKPKRIALCIFPALRASYRWLLGIVIGSSRRLFLLWLVGVISLVLVFRQSFENRCNNNEINRQYDLNRFIRKKTMVLGHSKEKFKCLQGSDIWWKMKWSLDIVARKQAAKENLVYID